MESSLEPLIDRLNQLSEQFPELREGVQKAVRIAEDDPEMALTRARKVLEHVVRDVFERRVKAPPGTRPLENLLQILVRENFFPARLDAYAATIRKLGNVGTHNFSETVTVTDVFRSLTELVPILEWYADEKTANVVFDNRASSNAAEPTTRIATPRPSEKSIETITVVPKGLRSFDGSDSDFFLQLLPGARDSKGLPQVIRFWKQRVESTDELTFTVGVIYGPSGCGKSSLMKAGLLPRLSKGVVSIYVEATADQTAWPGPARADGNPQSLTSQPRATSELSGTELRLLKALRKRFPRLPSHLSLSETVAALRPAAGPKADRSGMWGSALDGNQKVLIVLDQFEQWLHAKRWDGTTELADALRQCDGEHVQCIVMVRDDFWLALSRFMEVLEIPLVVGENAGLVDLFDLIHARKVLAEFGRSFGRLSQDSEHPSPDGELFLDRAVEGLAQDGRVIAVRLALFAEMIKGKPWTTTTLKDMGGFTGVGVSFLEETFGAITLRHHERAARAVLKTLLPEQGTDIKGTMRSQRELMDASGYSGHPKEFGELLRILDNDVRLITPTDLELGDPGSSAADPSVQQNYYQLTHDYLVHSLREWLTRKQKETRRGRAELKLAEQSAFWNSKPDNRFLPSFLEYARIRLLTEPKNWTAPQRKMMRKARRVYGVWTGIAAALLLVGVAVSLQIVEKRRAEHAAGLVEQLVVADISEVPGIVQKLKSYHRWADPLLRQEEADAPPGSNKRLHVALALLPVDEGELGELETQLLHVSPREFDVVRQTLSPMKDKVSPSLWEAALDPHQQDQQRFQAACALAVYAPAGRDWSRINALVAKHLLGLDASALVAWRKSLWPARDQLIRPLAAIYRDLHQSDQSRTYAAETLADYAADRPDELFDLLADSEPFQFSTLFVKLAKNHDRAASLAEAEMLKKPPEHANEQQKERLAKRQVSAADVLLRLGMEDRVWPMLKRSPDPRGRSYFIHRISILGGADPRKLAAHFEHEPDAGIRQALLLTLGQFDESQWPSSQRQPLIDHLFSAFENEPDPGVHGAIEWLLRKWKKDQRLQSAQEKLRGNDAQFQARKSVDKRLWYINSHRQTFVIVDASRAANRPSAASPAQATTDPAAGPSMAPRFAIAATEVTKSQFTAYRAAVKIKEPKVEDFVKTDDSPQTGMNWYQAAGYCNWLSKEEGIPKDQFCYAIPAKNRRKYQPRENYLALTGYRLPTEAEWEFACRAGTVTDRYYGSSVSLLPNYAWFAVNSGNRTWPVGTLKPNDWGIFDMLGNASEWCSDLAQDALVRTQHSTDEAKKTQLTGDVRVLRGAAFEYLQEYVKSGLHMYSTADQPTETVGFRPVRTLP